MGHVLTALAMQPGCSPGPECGNPDYSDPECRVLAENELARVRAGDGATVRFVDPAAPDGDGWIAAGLVTAGEPGRFVARVAGLGPFALRVEAAGPLTLVLDNVDPAARVTVSGPGGEIEVAARTGLSRQVVLDMAPGTEALVAGERACPPRFRLAAVGDIQTNPLQFERILERLVEEEAAAAALGEPLLGLLLLGDLSESARAEEFDRVAALLAKSPVPVAATPGNHDIVFPTAPLFSEYFGPGNYAFALCGVRVAMLDTASGSIAASVEARLDELLDHGEARFLLAGTHYPTYTGFNADGWSREDQAQHLMVELARHGADALLAGHLHALRHYPSVPIGDLRLREVIVGTGGAQQGLGAPRFGYLRLGFGEAMSTCFVEVPPPGVDGPLHGSVPGVPMCDAP